MRLRAVAFAACLWSSTSWAYDKATESNEVVLNKLYPKKGRTELDAKFGLVLNSSYLQTFLVTGGLSYFWSEEWGFNLEGNMAIVSDKNERKCVETFYNDPNYAVDDECGEDSPKSQDPDGNANWGPAYVPIRKLKYMFTGNMVWNPIYGKQIVLLSATNYFDFYISMGGGIAMSDYYPIQKDIPGGNSSRGASFCTKSAKAKGSNCTNATDPGTDDPNLIGESGRPVPEAQSTPLVHMAIGQRFHFLKRFMVTGSLDDYLLLGTPSGFENFLTLTGGFGVRF